MAKFQWDTLIIMLEKKKKKHAFSLTGKEQSGTMWLIFGKIILNVLTQRFLTPNV